jgi:DNA-binding transcriptional regulator YiaG
MIDYLEGNRKRKMAGKRIEKKIEIPGQSGIRVIQLITGVWKLELRYELQMTRPLFSRLINVSERAVAEVESKQKKVDKLQRNYVEVKRLCDALAEVLEPSVLGEWFNSANDSFGGLKPIEVIERGEIDRLWEMFFRLRSGISV